MDDNSIFIRLLRFGEERGANGVSDNEFKIWALKQPEIDNDSCIEFRNVRMLFYHSFQPAGHISDDYILKVESYFRLVEFQELKESREASSDANFYSKIAIGFSIFAILLGGAIGVLQLNSSITLDVNQVSKMATKDYPVSQNIESEQLTQVIEALKQSNINTAELTRMIREQKGVVAEVK